MANNQLLASDSFVSGSLAAGWAVFPTLLKCQVVVGSPNVTEPTVVGTTAGQLWIGITWPTDQTSELTVKNLVIGGNVGLAVRFSSSVVSGYLVVLKPNGGQFTISRFDNGVETILATISSVTFNANDVWAFQAAGSCLTVYQNGSRMGYTYDATYTSGFPGYDQNTTVALTESQVSAWRGYSAIQQDGIWQKQGIVVAPSATDLAVTPVGQGLQVASIFLDGNAQLLSGNVYKMWIINNWAATTNVGGIYYAESLDGINWTRRSAAVLTGYTNASVFKFGSTYYMYAQTNAGNGHGTIQVLTSSDGLNWALQSPTQTISQGAAGAWDDQFIYEILVIDVVSGIWYGMYSGAHTGTFHGGLVTSTDGINWMKYAGNPVNTYLPVSFVKVGSIYYGWFQAYQPGQSSNSLDPTEIIRYQTTDFINWTNPVHSLHHSQMFESLNSNTGQTFAAGNVLTVGGKAYLWYNPNQNDSAGSGPHVGQIGLAIGPVSVASVVTQKEDAIQQIANDSFTSGVGNLSSNWVTPTGATKLQIVSGNLCEATALAINCAMAYTGAVFSNDQYSEITIATLTDINQFVAPIVRAQTGASSWYGLSLSGPLGSATTTFQLIKRVAGTNTLIGPTAQVTPQVGDVFRLAVTTGSDGFPVLSAYQNGFLIIQFQDYSNTLTSGFPGLVVFAQTSLANAQISLWAGGNAGVIPNYNPPNLFVARIDSCAPRREPNTWEVIYLYPLDAGGIGEALVVVGPNQAIAQWPTSSSTITIPSSPGSSQQFTFPPPPIVQWGTFGIGTFGGTHGFPSFFFA